MSHTLTVSVYTTHNQTEQPLTIYKVMAITTVGGVLIVQQSTGGRHQFDPGQWTHFECLTLDKGYTDATAQ